MKHRITYLDCLRCIAILFVIVLHAMSPILSNPVYYGIASWYLCLLQNPLNRTGVPLFFMISGYLILRSPDTLIPSTFYRRHLLRLALPLCAWNLIYLLADALRTGVPVSLDAFFSSLLNRGQSYHMWFVYTMMGIYLAAPFLKRITDACTGRQLSLLLLLIIFPTSIRPLLNTVLPVYIYLFDPILEGYLGFFLMGYLLGHYSPGRRMRAVIYCGGVIGYLWGVLGNLWTSSPKQVPLPFNGGYSLNHYLCAAALFLLCKTVCTHHERDLRPLEKMLASASNLVFGVYWIHVLILDSIADLLGGSVSVIQLLSLEISLTVVISFCAAMLIAKIPFLKKILI